MTAKTGGTDHPSPVRSEESGFIRISNSLIIDVEIITFRSRVLSDFRNEWSFISGIRCSLAPDFAG
jgi:hypothetical protein